MEAGGAEQDCGALGGLFQLIMTDMKVFKLTSSSSSSAYSMTVLRFSRWGKKMSNQSRLRVKPARGEWELWVQGGGWLWELPGPVQGGGGGAPGLGPGEVWWTPSGPGGGVVGAPGPVQGGEWWELRSGSRRRSGGSSGSGRRWRSRRWSEQLRGRIAERSARPPRCMAPLAGQSSWFQGEVSWSAPAGRSGGWLVGPEPPLVACFSPG
ncbi:hypothetical protein CRUP_031331 [Coryphaenoides rupestris]|nr:hypothetical protein CRUP_031331 [Coryphaenoides rupestris]